MAANGDHSDEMLMENSTFEKIGVTPDPHSADWTTICIHILNDSLSR
jgi:hypothetical protein